MKSFLFRASTLLLLLSFACILTTMSCSKHMTNRAGQGAATGAAVGAVGGLVTALVFGGDPVDRAARGAVYGGAAGATAGAIAGSREDKAKKKQQEAQAGAFRKKMGEDVYNGVVALAECKHPVALANAQVAVNDKDPNRALAGLWLEVLIYADNREEDKAREKFSKIIEKDRKIASDDQVEAEMRAALQTLGDIREEHDLQRVCK